MKTMVPTLQFFTAHSKFIHTSIICVSIVLVTILLQACNRTIDLRDESDCETNCYLINGNAAYTDGEPIEKKKISVLAMGGYGLLGTTTICVAETKTDKNGDYNLMFQYDSTYQDEYPFLEIVLEDVKRLSCGRSETLNFLDTYEATLDSLYIMDYRVTPIATLDYQIKDLRDLPDTSAISILVEAENEDGETFCTIGGFHKWDSKSPGIMNVPAGLPITFTPSIVRTSNQQTLISLLTASTFTLAQGEKKTLVIEWK